MTGTSTFRIEPQARWPLSPEAAAAWFSDKWGIPAAAYLESFRETPRQGVPAWYLAFPEDGCEPIGGIGVIENDFHKRPDLRPNLCALYVAEAWRRRGIARALLDTACAALAAHHVGRVYLLTDHTQFYEHCGFAYLCDAEDAAGARARVYVRNTVEARRRCPPEPTQPEEIPFQS